MSSSERRRRAVYTGLALAVLATAILLLRPGETDAPAGTEKGLHASSGSQTEPVPPELQPRTAQRSDPPVVVPTPPVPAPAAATAHDSPAWLRVVRGTAPLPGVVAHEMTPWEAPGARVGLPSDKEGLLRARRGPTAGTRVHLHVRGYEAKIMLVTESEGIPVVELLPLDAPTHVVVEGPGEPAVAGLLVLALGHDGQQVRAREGPMPSYEIPLAPQRIRQVVLFDPQCRYAITASVLPHETKPGMYHLSMVRSREWRVLVTDAATGKPIPSAAARDPFLGESERAADDDGVISWPYWTHEQTGGMLILAPGYRRAWCVPGDRGPKDLIEVELTRGPWVRGVLTLDGTPVVGAIVMGDRTGFPPEYAVTSDAGAYELRSLEAHARAIRVKHAHLGVHIVALPVAVTRQEGPVEMDIELQTTPLTVSVSHRGRPVSGALVTCGAFEATSDGNGNTELRGLFDSARVVWASHEGLRGVSQLLPQGRVAVELGALDVITGHVPGVERGRVVLLETLASDQTVLTADIVRTSATGQFRFEGVIRGYPHRVRVAGTAPALSREPVFAGEVVEFDPP